MRETLRRLPRRSLLASALALIGWIALPDTLRADLIPSFARKYEVSCSLCHGPFPRLTDFGETFAGNGFLLARGEPARDTVDTQDRLLRLPAALPLAVRVDNYVQGLTRKNDGKAVSDLQTPWMIKVLSGGPITDDVSYYLYFFLSERGEVAGLEDAYLQLSDAFGTGVDVLAGQFQVSDPMFKRELRVEYEDYVLYRSRIGAARADLTYDRGLMLVASPRSGTDAVFQVVNGQGLREAETSRQYDRDSPKNIALHVSQEAGPLRFGGFLYRGWERSEGHTDDILVWGPDATFALTHRTELNLQYLRRTDSNPFFLDRCESGSARCFPERADPFEVTTDGVLAELLFFPGGQNGRWVLSGLLNWVDSDRRAVSLRVGEEELLERYRVGAVGATYLVARNLRLLGEAAWDLERDRGRFTFGAVTAF